MPLFNEIQRFRQPWLWAPLVGVAGWFTLGVWQQVVAGEPFGTNPMGDLGLLLVWLFSVLPLLGLLFITALRTEVREDGVHVRYFPFHLRERRFPLETLVRVEVVNYRPLLEYGGWGIRRGPKGWAYNVSGRRGVRFTFDDGRRFLIGTREPEAFAQAVKEAVSLHKGVDGM